MSKILLVDDDSFFREVTTMTLEKEGYTVVHAIDGDDALKKFDKEGPFDLIILDVVMPNKDGIEFAKIMQERKNTVKIIPITGGGPVSIGGPYLKLIKMYGSEDGLLKPFSNADLLAAVKKALA